MLEQVEVKRTWGPFHTAKLMKLDGPEPNIYKIGWHFPENMDQQ